MGKSSNPMQNKESVLDFDYATQISIWLLKPLGAWPLHEQATVWEIFVHGLSIAITTFLQLFLIVTSFAFLIVTNASFYEIVRTACPLIFVNTVFLRYLLLLLHRDEIRSCINQVAQDWRNMVKPEHREIMLSNAKLGRFFGIISTTFMFGSGLPFCIMPLVIPSVVDENNITIRTLPNPCDLIFMDVQVNSMYGDKSISLEARNTRAGATFGISYNFDL